VASVFRPGRPADEAGARFREALEAARRRQADEERTGFREPRGVPFVVAPAAAADGAGALRTSAEERWREAQAWAAEPLDPACPDAARIVLDDRLESIAEELGLGGSLTLTELQRRWRRFVWLNHPDRQPDAARAAATRRMAVASMLVDRARREILARR